MLTATITLAVSTVILTIVTALYAYSNYRYVKLVQLQLLWQTGPHVIVFTKRTDNPDIVEIVIKNFGNGFAKDIRFERAENVDKETWNDFLTPSGGTSTPLSNSPIVHGITTLPPQEEMIIRWETKGFSLRTPHGLHLVCTYKRLGPGPESEVESTICFLDALPEIKKE
jgi:hypothetical protein